MHRSVSKLQHNSHYTEGGVAPSTNQMAWNALACLWLWLACASVAFLFLTVAPLDERESAARCGLSGECLQARERELPVV